MSTEESNVLIAEFMGFNYLNRFDHLNKNNNPFNDYACYTFPNQPNDNSSAFVFVKDMLYHLSWEWLMPAVERIEHDLPNDYYYHTDHNSVWFSDIHDQHKKIFIGQGGRLTATYQAVVEFIQWYNQNKES